MLFTSRAATIVALAATASYAAPAERRDNCAEDIEPIQVRLAYHGDRGMSVSWNTNAKLDKPTVYFGTTMDLGKVVTSDSSVTYPTSSTWNNHVVITGLDPNTRYHYQPECSDRIYSFTTARTAGDGHDFKFAMVGDMGTMGPDGLSTTVGKGAANPLAPGAATSIDSLHSLKESFDFVWHGRSALFNIVFSQLTDI
jgi:acid phosphatase type 7